MSIKTISVLFLTLTSSLLASDIVEPTAKKEAVPSLTHVWLSGDLLCLQAKENRLDYANNAQGITPSANYTTSSVVQPHFAWNCGVKIDAGFQPEDWFFFANWTHIVNTAKGVSSTNGSEGFFPLWSLGSGITDTGYVTSAHFDWSLDTQIVDVGSIISWGFGKRFILKAHGAIRTAFLDQRFNIQYGGGFFSEGTDTVTMKNNFFGVGPAIGLSPNIMLGRGFNILGDIAGSALLGSFFLKQKEKYLRETLFYETNTMTRVRYSLDAKAAINWQTEFLYKSLVFSIQTGWEWHKYYDQNQLQQNSFDFFNDKRSLILRGGFISLTLGF